MLRPRIIPCLLVKNGGLVKTVRFGSPKYVGDPINAVRIFNEKEVDELIVLDIDATAENRAPWRICCVSRSARARTSPSCDGLSTARKISATRLCGSLACSLARLTASSISSSEISVVCAACRRTSLAQTIPAVS